jgi:hypothetical protein
MLISRFDGIVDLIAGSWVCRMNQKLDGRRDFMV